jgi:hypothetical protein
MNRLKFLIFALVALGLWIAHLQWISPRMTAVAVKLAGSQASLAGHAVALKLQERQTEMQQLLQKLSLSPAVTSALQNVSRSTPPTEERLATVRNAVLEAIPDQLERGVAVGLATEGGILWGEPSQPPTTAPLALKEILDAPQGAVQEAFGKLFMFYAFPGKPLEKDARLGPQLLLGTPLLPEDAARRASMDARGVGIAIMLDGQPLQFAGDGLDAARAARLDRAVKAGKEEVFERGTVAELWSVKLPIWTQPDTLGLGEAPLNVLGRQALPGTPFEVIALVSIKPVMEGLAAYQTRAVFALLGLGGLSLLWLIIMGSGRAPARRTREESEEPTQMVHHRPEPVFAERPTEPTFMANGTPGPSRYDEPAPMAPEVGPEAFEFPPQSPHEPPTRAMDPSEMPPAHEYGHGLPPPVPDSPAEWNTEPGQDPSAYDAPRPFEAPPQDDGYGEESTRVAMVPDELLRASARPQHEEEPPPEQEYLEPPPMPPPSINAEDQHFQEVFQNFVATREQCGEPADGLTFEKFSSKLRKNRDQLIQKYNCRTVRFQVYIKDGKAALKATPVKD